MQKAQAEKRPFMAVVCFWGYVVADWLKTAVCGGLGARNRLAAVRRVGRWPVVQAVWAEKRPFWAVIRFWWRMIDVCLETAACGGLGALSRLAVIGGDRR